LGGVLDEGYQHLVIYAAIPGAHFDWNDVILNAIGAAWATICAASGRGAESPRRQVPSPVWMVAIVAALGVTW
jgi:hypothetical protein